MSDKYTEIKINNYFLEKDTDDIDFKLAHLIIEGVIFCNNGWWYKEEGINWPEDHVTLHVNCNDIFDWGCADSEDVTHKEINELYEFYKKDSDLGAAAWCIKKRKQMPQPPVKKHFEQQGIWNLEDLIKLE